VGGAQMRFVQLASAHAERYRHTIIALDGENDMSKRVSHDLNVSYRAVPYDKAKGLLNLGMFRNIIFDVRPDVLVTYNWGSIEWVLANIAGPRVQHVHIEDGFGPEEASGQFRRRIWMRRMALSWRWTSVVLPSLKLFAIARDVWRLPKARLNYIPNGIDSKRFFVDFHSRAGKTSPLVVGTLATLRKEKALDRLIQAFGALAGNAAEFNSALLIVGEGPVRSELSGLVDQMGLSSKVTFAGATSEPERWYPQMDIFALSSRTEQMPFSVLEAMAAGLPVVAFAVGDVPQMVAAENAPYIVHSEVVQEFAQRLGELLHNATLREEVGRANQRKAQSEYDESIMARRYAELFG